VGPNYCCFLPFPTAQTRTHTSSLLSLIFLSEVPPNTQSSTVHTTYVQNNKNQEPILYQMIDSSNTAPAPNSTTTSTENNDAEKQKQAKYKATCDGYVKNGLTGNRSIQYLIKQLDNMGCTPPAGFIRCTDCGDLQALGAFHLLSETTVESPTPPSTTAAQQQQQQHDLDPQTAKKDSITAACSTYFLDTLNRIGRSAKNSQEAQDRVMEQLNNSNQQTKEENTTKTPEIFLCQQHLSSEGQTHRTIVHELVHAIDACRSKMDPQKNCIHLACTEIRAENLSNECTFFNELQKIGPHSLKKHGQDCVRRRALLSVSAHPKCRERAEEYVDAAMGRCYKDIFPFEHHPNEQGW